MVEESKLQSIAVRFAAYIEELREFFTTRAVRFGSPEDLVRFAELVAEPGAFQDEMGSMVRSIVFRENETLGRGELLELVAVAVGGPGVETAAQEMHTSVRQVFVFVNDALRNRQQVFSREIEHAPESTVTAGDILAASGAAKEALEGQSVAGRSPENGFHAERTTAGAGERAVPEQDENRTAPTGNSVLFRAVSMAEAEAGDERPGSRMFLSGAGRPRWMIPAIAAAVAVLGIGAFVYEHGNGTHAGPGSPVTVGGVGTAASAATCIGSTSTGASRAGLEERARWAHGLLDQKMYEAALPELRDVAKVDPGYPGINLDESDALLNLKRPDDAREAIDTQIGISECLAKLPSAALDNYCSAEFSGSSVGSCRPQLAHIRQAAQLQAALVHLELGHRVGPDAGSEATPTDFGRPTTAAPEELVKPRATADAAAPAPARTRHFAPLPPASEGDLDRPVAAPRAVAQAKPQGVKPAAAKPARKGNSDDSLIHGEGTDSAFGAYSKPQ